MPSTIETRQFFDEHVSRIVETDFDNTLFTKETNSILELLGNQTGILLDIGCGNGVYTKCIAESNPNLFVVGIDISLESIKQAEPKKNIEYLVSDITHLPFQPQIFDALVAINVLHHVGNVMFNEPTRILKRKGVILISDHVINNPFAFALRKIFSYLPMNVKSLRTDASATGQVPPIFLYSVKWLNNTLRLSGFQIKHSNHFEVFSSIVIGTLASLVRENTRRKLFKIWFICNLSEERLLKRMPFLQGMGYKIRIFAVRT